MSIPAFGRGRVSIPRRPPGWRAPGPVPPGSPHARPGSGEDLCCLAGDWRILQNTRGHRWSLDDLVTAWLAASEMATRPPGRIADLGCGIGAVLLLLAWRFPEARALGIETQEASAGLARRSILWNGAGERCEVRTGDLRDAALVPEGPIHDLVTATPPYLAVGAATEPTRVQQAGCHIELRGGIEDYCAAAARLLAPAGRLVACHSQPMRAAAAARVAGFEVARRLEVIPRAGKPALFSVFSLARVDDPGVTRVDPPLVVRDREGQWTAEFRDVRRDMGMPF